MMRRGDIHYIMEGRYTGSEQIAGRPAVIVSNDKCNLHSPVVEIVFLTTKPKTDLPTHVSIRSTVKPSIALCEQITSVSTERLGDYAGTCTPQEMQAINNALLISLALNLETPPAEDSKLIEDLKKQIHALHQEKEMYKNTYDKVIESILDRRS